LQTDSPDGAKLSLVDPHPLFHDFHKLNENTKFNSANINTSC